MIRLGHELGAIVLEPPHLQWQSVPTPLGPMLIVVSELGVCACEFDRDAPDDADVRRWYRRFGKLFLTPAKKPLPAALALAAYFAGRGEGFDLNVDLRGLTEFQQRVLLALSRVPLGQTVQYADLARAVGQPGAARAVGGAMARNPIPVILPCHRVLGAAGLGGFSGGLELKRSLLLLEGVLA